MSISLQEWDFANWSWMITPGFCTAIMIGMEILSIAIPPLFGLFGFKRIPVKGYYLEKFSQLDLFYIAINKFLTVMFVYHILYVCYYTPSIKWRPEELTLSNSLGSLVLFYLFYDFFYMNFHRILHFRWLYPLIHKHHHRQKAPTRGNLDAINVHPVEFFVGEYLHLVTAWVIPCHVYTVAFFVIIGGVLASLNHTRFDIDIPYLFNVSLHDVHHRLPESNYAQYIYFWDYLFGSYRPYSNEFAGKDSD